MNKKTIALALILCLGGSASTFKTMSVTPLAQSVTSRSDDIDFNVLKFETITTSIMSTGANTCEMSFSDIDLSKVDTIEDVKFDHRVFSEREGIDDRALSAKGVWDKETQKLKLTGIDKPGIYTAFVTIRFTDGSVSNHTVSFIKEPQDSISFSADITAGKIIVDDLKINGKSINNIDNKFDVMIGGIHATKVNGKYEVSLLDIGKVKDGDRLGVQLNFGKGFEHSAKGQIVLTKSETMEITPIVANSENFMDEMKAQVRKDFSENAVVDMEYDFSTEKYKLFVNGLPLVNFDQSYYLGNKGGGQLSVTKGKQHSTIDVTIKHVGKNSGEKYFIPNVQVSNLDGTMDSGVIGDYYINIGDWSTLYFKSDVSFKLTPDNKKVQVSEGYLSKSVILGNDPFEINLMDADHGYSSILVSFNVDAKEDLEKLEKVSNEPTIKESDKPVVQNVNGSISKTSIILSVDSLDAKFEELEQKQEMGSFKPVNATLSFRLNDLGHSLNFNSKFEEEYIDDGEKLFFSSINNKTIKASEVPISDIDMSDSGFNVVQSNVTSGKYQGLYSYGVDVIKELD